LQKIQAGFAASAGMSVKQLDEQIREFDATLEWQKKMWEQQGLPQLAIQQRAADLEEKKFAELTEQAHRQQGWVEEIGRRQADLAEKTQADANALGQSQLGLQTLQTAANLRGPADWIQAANFSRGVRNSRLPGFIQQLLSGGNTGVLGGAAPGSQMSAPNTLGSLAGELGAGGLPTMHTMDMVEAAPGQWVPRTGSTGGAATRFAAMGPSTMGPENLGTYPRTAPEPDVDYAAQRLRQVYAQGGQSLGPQALEGLTPTEMSMFTGGGESVGADVPGFVEQYKRSRIGQKSTYGAY